ncbi:MAG: hypothetical protein ACFE85_06950 [Candidatus Hodarchaeota archaeon]
MKIINCSNLEFKACGIEGDLAIRSSLNSRILNCYIGKLLLVRCHDLLLKKCKILSFENAFSRQNLFENNDILEFDINNLLEGRFRWRISIFGCFIVFGLTSVYLASLILGTFMENPLFFLFTTGLLLVLWSAFLYVIINSIRSNRMEKQYEPNQLVMDDSQT